VLSLILTPTIHYYLDRGKSTVSTA
jgi:hypothetical protein